MEKPHTHFKILTTVWICLLGVLLSSFVLISSANPQQTMSSKELKSLIKNAKTPADHQKLATYYKYKAQKLIKQSKEHEELAEAYANRTLYEPKTGIPGGLFAHCRNLAGYYAKAGKEAEEMAAMHEELAKRAAKQMEP